MWQISRAWQRGQDRVLREFELTQMQFAVLAHLVFLLRQKEQVSQQELADYAGIEKMQMSQVLKLMESRDLIKRKRQPGMGRALAVVPTTKGRQKLKKALPAIEAFDLEFFYGKDRNADLNRLAGLLNPEPHIE